MKRLNGTTKQRLADEEGVLLPGEIYKHRKTLDMCIYVDRELSPMQYVVYYCDKEGRLYSGDSEVVEVVNASEWKRIPYKGWKPEGAAV